MSKSGIFVEIDNLSCFDNWIAKQHSKIVLFLSFFYKITRSTSEPKKYKFGTVWGY